MGRIVRPIWMVRYILIETPGVAPRNMHNFEVSTNASNFNCNQLVLNSPVKHTGVLKTMIPQQHTVQMH